MSELRAGDSLDFTVGDKTLTVEPLPYGVLKKILRVVFSVAEDIKSGALTSMPDLVDKYMGQVLPLLFRRERYPWLTTEWIEDNLTIPTIRRIIEAAVVVNGLQDFFGKAVAGMNGLPPPTPETPSERPGSITSSGSPTAGDPGTSTN